MKVESFKFPAGARFFEDRSDFPFVLNPDGSIVGWLNDSPRPVAPGVTIEDFWPASELTFPRFVESVRDSVATQEAARRLEARHSRSAAS